MQKSIPQRGRWYCIAVHYMRASPACIWRKIGSNVFPYITYIMQEWKLLGLAYHDGFARIHIPVFVVRELQAFVLAVLKRYEDFTGP